MKKADTCDLLENIRSLAYNISNRSDHVKINEEQISIFASVEKDNLPTFQIKKPKNKQFILNTIMSEIVFNSINYCYWYGDCEWRPGGASATNLANLIKKCADKFISKTSFLSGLFIETLKAAMITLRYPLLEQRIKHLDDINSSYKPLEAISQNLAKTSSCSDAIPLIVRYYPGYAGDVFLKRAQLFCMQIQKKCNLFDDIECLTIPADYHVPAVLRELGILDYSDKLSQKIQEKEIIPSGSKEEVEIRAATIVAGDKLAELTGTNTMIIDEYLWNNRDMETKPFHLTVTTDY